MLLLRPRSAKQRRLQSRITNDVRKNAMRHFFSIALLLLGNCVTVPRDGGLPDVQRELRARSNQTVELMPPAMADEERVLTTLRTRKLDAETAVGIALMNNPQVQ